MNTVMPDDPPPIPGAPQGVAGAESARYDADLNRRVIVLETRFETVLPTLATKADIADLRSEMRASNADLRSEMRAANAELRSEMGSANVDLRAELLTAMEKLRADISSMFTKMLISIIGIFIAFFLGIAGLMIAASNTMLAVSAARPLAMSLYTNQAPSSRSARNV